MPQRWATFIAAAVLVAVIAVVGTAQQESIEELRAQAEQGDAEAQFNLGLIYGDGQGVPQDYAEAARWWRLAADQGYRYAQYNLGLMSADGLNVPQDYAEAVRWWRLAADQGYADAQYNLGVMSADGLNVPQDYAEALRWFRLAAEQEHALAQVRLGSMFSVGLGVPEDDVEAARWYRLAAEQGNADGFSQLGYIYSRGEGVPQDFVQAYVWFSLEAASEPPGENRDLAIANRDLVASDLTPAQLIEAQRLARDWTPSAITEPGVVVPRLEAAQSQDNGENQASADGQMSTALKLFLLALPLSFLKPFIDWPIFIITVLAGLVSLVTPIAAPREYVVMAIAFYVFTATPRIRLSAVSIMNKLIPEPKPSPRASGGMSDWLVKRTLGDSLLGATTGLAYNAYWLDYAATNSPSWLI